MSSHDAIISEIPLLTYYNFPAWWYAVENHLYRFGSAYDEIEANKEISLEHPDIDSVTKSINGDDIYLFDHTVGGVVTAEGRKEHRSNNIRLDASAIPIKKDRKDCITFFYNHMSPDSLKRMRAMIDYPAAKKNVSSFQILACITESHNKKASFPLVAKRHKAFCSLSQTADFSSFQAAHAQGVKELIIDMESPTHKGYISIDLLTSILLMNGIGPQFNTLKDTKLFDRDIQTLQYTPLSQELTLYASHREDDTSLTTSISQSILNLQNKVPGNVAFATTSNLDNTSTCVQCKSQFPTVIKKGGSPNECHERCKPCYDSNIKVRKANQLKITDSEANKKDVAAKALAKAQQLIVKSGGTVNMTSTPAAELEPGSTSTPTPSYRDMLDYAMWKNQISVTITPFETPNKFQMPSDKNHLLSTLTAILSIIYFAWDNCASFSVCSDEAVPLLIEYVLIPPNEAESIEGFTGAGAKPVGYGFLPHLQLIFPNLRVYHVPAAKTNILSLGQVCQHGGSYGGNGKSLRVYDANNCIISDTKCQSNNVHLVPSNLIHPPSAVTEANRVNASFATYSSSLQLAPYHYTKEQLMRMKITFDLHVFLLHLCFTIIRNAVEHHAFGPNCILVPSDIDRLLQLIGKCAICVLGKMTQLSMTELSTTCPADIPGWKWTLDLQSLPKKHHGGFTDAAIFRDDHTGVPRYFGIIGKKTEESIMPAVIELISFCLSFGRKVRQIVPDSELCLVLLKIPCGLLGIQVTPVPAKEHGKASERSIRTVDNLVTCSLQSAPQKFKPELTLYAKQAAAAAIALVPTLGKDIQTCGYTILTQQNYEYHSVFPFLPLGCSVLAEVGVAHRQNESLKSGFAYNNCPKSEICVNLGPDLYGTQKGCFRFYPASGNLISRRNFEPINAIMPGWEPNFVIRQSQRQFELCEETSNNHAPPTTESNLETITPSLTSSIDTRTLLAPTSIEVTPDFYSSTNHASPSIPAEKQVEEIVDNSAPVTTLPQLSHSPKSPTHPLQESTNWTQVTSKRTNKTSAKAVPFTTTTRNSTRPATTTPSAKIFAIIRDSIINLKKNIQTEFSLSQALKKDHIRDKIPAAVQKELSKITKFSAGRQISKENIPKGAVLLHFLMRIKEKMILDGQLDPQVNARMVIDGLRQKREHPDSIGETFAGTPNMKYFIVLLAVLQADAIEKKRLSELTITSLDIEAAFLQTKKKPTDPIEVAQIPLNVPHPSAGEFFLIDCGWYGKGNGNRYFWIDFGETVLLIPGVSRCPYDSSKFIWICKTDPFRKVLLNAHVDDGAKLSTWPEKLLEIQHILTSRYGPLKLFKPMKNYLGLQFTYHQTGAITIHMTTHITSMVKDFNISISETPLVYQPAPLNVLNRDSTSPSISVETMQKANGKILFPAVQIRSDVLLATQNSCSHNSSPTEQDARDLINIVEYFASTSDLGPTFYTTGGAVLKAKCDTAFAVDPITGQSRTALSLHIGDFDNAACFAKTWLLTIISNAASLAEFIGMSDVSRIINEYRNLLEWAGFPQTEPTPIGFLPNGDSQMMPTPTELQNDCASAITMVLSEDMTKQGKHFRARQNYVRQEYQFGTIAPVHVPTKNFSIDFMTKACVGQDFKNKRNQHFNVKANPDFQKYL